MVRGHYSPKGDSNRLHKLKAKATAQENDEIREAARRSGVTLSHFLILSATRQARQVLTLEGGAQ